MKLRQLAALTAVMGMLATVAVAPVLAHENAFQKAGKAIQYTTRKDSETMSIDAHRAEHKNSMHHVRNHHYKEIITPAGDKVWFHHPMHKTMKHKM